MVEEEEEETVEGVEPKAPEAEFRLWDEEEEEECPEMDAVDWSPEVLSVQTRYMTPDLHQKQKHLKASAPD